MYIEDIAVEIDLISILNRINRALDTFKKKRIQDTKLMIKTFVICIFVYSMILLLFIIYCPYNCTLKEHSDYAILFCLFILAFVSFVFIPDSFNSGDLNILPCHIIYEMLDYRKVHKADNKKSNVYDYLNEMPGISELVPEWSLISAAYTNKMYISVDMKRRKLFIQYSEDSYELSLSDYNLRNIITHAGINKVIIAWNTVQLISQ